LSSIHEKVHLLEERFEGTTDEILQVDLLNSMAFELRHLNSALSMQKSSEAAARAERIGYHKGTAAALLNQGFGEMNKANYTAAFLFLHKAIAIFDELNDEPGRGQALYINGLIYLRIGDNNASLDALNQSLAIRRSIGDQKGEAACLSQLGYILLQFGNLEQSFQYFQQGLAIERQISNKAGIGLSLMALGMLEKKRGRYAEAEAHLLESLRIRNELGETEGWLVSMNYVGELYIVQNRLEEAARCLDEAIVKAEQQVPPSPNSLCKLYTARAKVATRTKDYSLAIDYLDKALQQATVHNVKYQLHDIYQELVEVYKQKGDYRNALINYEKYHQAKEEVINMEVITKLKNVELANQIEDERKQAEIHRLRNIELKNAYEQLEARQAQLIHSEKMASLGELTAGIAHEIQNPLNFVNNFSEVNRELIGDLIEEVDRRNIEAVKEIANAIMDNEERINHHGRRADSIVRNMMQHSQSGNEQKEWINMNDLCEEYLRLSYHGVRAKDKTFTSAFDTDFDESLDQINVIPQEIGRVLLNLFNNAFYAVHERKLKSTGTFNPKVLVATKKENKKAIIKVIDNGHGVPQNLVEKIFQPFFTTKPTGQGTGLGLSLSYDIITKGHGGTLSVRTTEEEGSEFIIELPIS
jgi:signal transduction histidine kinase